MSPRIPIAVDLSRGEAQIGEVVLPIAEAGSRGELRVGGPEGPVLRPLAFGERTRIVTCALAVSDPRESVCAGILRAATVSPGAFDRRALEVMALILAGAACSEAPSFADALLLVARGAGWTPDQLAEAEAAEVDRLAIHLGGTRLAENLLRRGRKWNRLVFLSTPDDILEVARAELADDLLARAEVGPESREDSEPFAAWERGPESLSPSSDLAGRQQMPPVSPRVRGEERGASPRKALTPTRLAEKRTERKEEKKTENSPSATRQPEPPASLGRGPQIANRPPVESRDAGGEREDPHPSAAPSGFAPMDVAGIAEIDSGIARLAEKRTEFGNPGGMEPQRHGGMEARGEWSQMAFDGRASGESYGWTDSSPEARPPRLSSPAWFDEEANPLSGTGEGVFGMADALAMLLHEEADLRGLDR